MCGMTGFSGENNFDIDKIKILMLANMTRGVHSSGLYNTGAIFKEGGNAIELLGKYSLIPEKIFLGHDRHATVGAKGDAKNAHPFKYGTIIGQHNGTLTNHWMLGRNAGFNMTDYDVDSQILISLIEKDKDKLKVLQEFEGAAALIWHDEDYPDRIYCFRNEKRPLYRGMIGKDMYISSIELSLDLIGCKKIQEFKERYVYTIENGKIINTSQRKAIEKKNFQKKYIHNTSSNFSSDINKAKNIDLLSRWVKRISATNSTGSFKQDKWYYISSYHSQYNLFLKNEYGQTVFVDKNDFSVPVNFMPGEYVMAMDNDGKYFKKGEILHLIGLSLSDDKKETIASCEKINNDGKVYMWGQNNFRAASKHEFEEYFYKQGSEHIKKESITTLNTEEQKIFDFENDEMNMDDEGNRLGSCWVEIGSGYESLIDLRIGINESIDSLATITELSDVRSLHLIKELDNTRNKLIKLFDIAENELDNMFDKVYQSENIE